MYSAKNKLASGKSRKKLIVIGAVILAAVVGVVILELTNTTHVFHNGPKKNLETTPNTTHRSAGQNTKGEGSSQSQPKNQSPSGASSQPEDNKTQDNSNTNATLVTPTGNFVSNHNPNLGNSPHPNTMQSVCMTTSGATCTITFTKDGITKALPVQATDKEGTTYWSWKLQDIGLTEGSWKIQATATLGSQTKSASDSIELVVGS